MKKKYPPIAINEGVPVRVTPWYTYEMGMGTIERETLNEVIKTLERGRLFRYDTRNLGDINTCKFELALNRYFDSKYSLGTSTLVLAPMTLALPKSYEVACTVLGFLATASAVILAGRKSQLEAVDNNLHFSLSDLVHSIKKVMSTL